MTQAELAREAGMSQPRIAEIENDRANPRLSTLDRLASVLGVETAELVRRPGSLPPG